MLFGEHFLHDDAVKPSAVFTANLAFYSDFYKAKRRVKGERAFTARFNSGDACMESGVTRNIEKAHEQ